MSVRGSRFATPIAPGAEHARTIGWWAMLFGIIALAHFVGATIVAYLYLRAGQAQWPPAGIEAPELMPGLIGTVTVFLAAVLASLEVRWTRSNGPFGMMGAAGAIIIGSIALWMQLGVLSDAPGWDENVYGSLFWLLAGTNAALIASGIGVSAALLVQHAMGHYDPERIDELRIGALFWWFVAIASVPLFLTLHLVPGR